MAIWGLELWPAMAKSFTKQGEENAFKEGERSWRAVVNTGSLEELRVWSSLAFHWLMVAVFDWLTSGQARREKEISLLLVGSTSFWHRDLILIEVSVY